MAEVSIPSRGFWFFEAESKGADGGKEENIKFQSPRGDFGFLNHRSHHRASSIASVMSFNPLAGILVF